MEYLLFYETYLNFILIQRKLSSDVGGVLSYSPRSV